MKRFIISILLILAPQASFAMDNFDDSDSLFNGDYNNLFEDDLNNNMILDYLDKEPFTAKDIDTRGDNQPMPISNNLHITNVAGDPSHDPNFIALNQAIPHNATPPESNNHTNKQGSYHCQVTGFPMATIEYKGPSGLWHHMNKYHPNNLNNFGCTIGTCRETFANDLELKNHRLDAHNIQDDKPLTTNQNEESDDDITPQNMNLNQANPLPEINNQQPQNRRKRSIDQTEANQPASTIGGLQHKNNNGDNPAQTAIKHLVCGYDGCRETFASNGGLYSHRNAAHTQVRKYSCHFCNIFGGDQSSKTYSDTNSFFVHLRGHTMPYQCNIDHCSKKFPKEDMLISHQKKDHGFTNTVRLGRNYSLKTSPCYMCGLQNITDLFAHKEQCKALLTYALVNINIEPNDENLLKLGFYESSTQFQCPDCGTIFESRHSRSAHIAGMHRKNLNNFACTVGTCREVFRTETELKKHRLEVHNIQDDKPLTTNQNEECDDDITPQNMNLNHAANVTTQIPNNTRITNAAGHPSHSLNFIALNQAIPSNATPLESNNLTNKQGSYHCLIPGCANTNKQYAGHSGLWYHMKKYHPNHKQ